VLLCRYCGFFGAALDETILIISRYLTREVIKAMLAVTLVLLLAFLSQQIVRYLNYVAVGKIPTNVLLQLVSFEIPYLLALLLPLGLYLGILIAYGRFYVDNEMIILQMAGYSQQRLLKLTFLIGLAIGAIVLYLMLSVNPLISEKRQQLMDSDEATEHLIQTMMPGHFRVSADGQHVMYVEKLSTDRTRAQNVFLAEQKAPSTSGGQPAWMLVFANEGYQEKAQRPGEQFFVTTEGYRYEGVPGQSDYKITQFRKYAVRLSQNNVHPTHEADEILTTAALWQSYDNPGHAAEFQWRFSMGILTVLLALLAVPLSAIRPRHGRYIGLLPAVLVYVVYINLLFMAERWVQLGTVSIGLGMWWVHVFMLLLVMAVFRVKIKA
jgi:lipopolysaccharide export system permease protein